MAKSEASQEPKGADWQLWAAPDVGDESGVQRDRLVVPEDHAFASIRLGRACAHDARGTADTQYAYVPYIFLNILEIGISNM